MGQGIQSENLSQTPAAPLSFSDKAVKMIQQAMQQKGMQGGAIRMTVAGAGCKGSLTV